MTFSYFSEPICLTVSPLINGVDLWISKYLQTVQSSFGCTASSRGLMKLCFWATKWWRGLLLAAMSLNYYDWLMHYYHLKRVKFGRTLFGCCEINLAEKLYLNRQYQCGRPIDFYINWFILFSPIISSSFCKIH